MAVERAATNALKAAGNTLRMQQRPAPQHPLPREAIEAIVGQVKHVKMQ